jgi:pyruvate/2-oxoacid:ferredoxin oxidoreductase alpha subunit/NAD-dependent dihydropyrimidine dehydrogenase PreA subunit
MPARVRRPRPVLAPEYCKGCGRCVDACEHRCITPGHVINAASGLVPVAIDLERCTGCGLCIDACPEPYGLQPALDDASGGLAPIGAPAAGRVGAEATPDVTIPIPSNGPVVVKGMHAAAIGALLAGCRYFFGYPITPSTEGAELMARLLPPLGGQFVQAVSEVAAINMLYGAGAAGVRATTFTSSPGFSLMLEGLSYMIGAQLPGVVVNVMRGGPGLGNIGPEQADIKLACRGLGHGNTHGIVLAPSTPQEMLDLTLRAFDLSFTYRNPVVVLGDGHLAQMTGRVSLPESAVQPGLPGWAVSGDAAHRQNLIASIFLSEQELEAHNRQLLEKYRRISEAEQRADLFRCDDADVLLVACNTPSRMAKGAVTRLRMQGIKAGLFRPVTLWPFPILLLEPLLERARRIVVVEASARQLEDELRLAASNAGVVTMPRIERVNRYGGVLPSEDEIVAAVRAGSRPAAGAAA